MSYLDDLFEAKNPNYYFVVIYLIFLMGYSPFLRSIGFWGSFYVFYHYGRRDELTGRYNYPSYLILREKIIKSQWKNGFNSDKLEEATK